MASPTSGSSVAGQAEPTGDSPASVAFGKYRLHQRIARGGMGEVYRASLVGELGFEKALVIKTILPELAAQPRFIELFAAEAKTAVALSHGNIVPIYELGRAEDTFYIVMGYVDGPSVSQLLATHRRRGHPPPLGVALSVIRGVLTGLAYAHTEEPTRGAIVHRDITPRNVMIERSGQVRIVDFGIARPANVDADVRAGSIGYVAPEQTRSANVDPRADVFSSGCLLYELLTLERAFPSKGVWMEPSLDAIPEVIRGPLKRALSLDPSDRQRDAGELLQTLGPAITQYAATFTEANLAGHLRTMYPQRRWGPAADPPAEELTPATAVNPDTETFATRLTPISAVDPSSEGESAALEPELEPGPESVSANVEDTPTPMLPVVPAPDEDPPRRGIGVFVAAAAVMAALISWSWLGRDDGSERPARSQPEVAAATPEPTPTTTPVPDRIAPPPEPTPQEPPEAPAPATVVVNVDPPTATIRIGDETLPGPSPFTVELPHDGEKSMTIEAPGHVAAPLVLRAGETEERSITLRPEHHGRGHLQVLAPHVSWAQVSVDGRSRGQTPLKRLELPAGSHRLVVKCVPDVCPEPKVLLRKTIEVHADSTTRVTVPR
ncbi:MAG: serine/threonine-protein kinase [Myxococcota bacterium]